MTMKAEATYTHACFMWWVQVMKDGRLQRFCYGCSRLQDLSAFDGANRHCRGYLHILRNRRHSKPGQDPGELSWVGSLLSRLLENPFQLQELRQILGMQTHTTTTSTATLAVAGGCAASATSAAEAVSSYELASLIMDGQGAFAPSFNSDQRVLRLVVKVFNITPQDLPQDLRESLVGWLPASPMALEGYIRPPSVSMCLHFSVSPSEYKTVREAGLQPLLAHLLSPKAHRFWHKHDYMLHLFDDVATVQAGTLQSLHRLDRFLLQAHRLPHGLSVSPLCLVTVESAELRLAGCYITGVDTAVLLKCGGQYLAPALVQQQQQLGVGAGSIESLQCRLQTPQIPGLGGSSDSDTTAAAAGHVPGSSVVWVEVSKGAYLSESRPVLLVEDPRLAEEVNNLHMGSADPGEVDVLLLDLAVVLGHSSARRQASSSSDRLDSASTRQQQLVVAPNGLIAEKAGRLLAFACDQGWIAVASALLPLAQPGILPATHPPATQDLSLLHRAVRSGSPATARAVLAWTQAQRASWPITSGGPGGVSPLHLSTLLNDAGVITLILLDACGVADALTTCVAVDGVSPFQLGCQWGHWGLDSILTGLGLAAGVSSVVEMQLQPTGWQLLEAATMPAEGDAAAAAAPQKRVKERRTTRLDACLYCYSILPPLLLTIKAQCAGCGQQQPCVAGGDRQLAMAAVAAEGQLAVVAAAAAVGASSSQPARYNTRKRTAPAAAPAAGRGTRGRAKKAASGVGCTHVSGQVLSVTAMCQVCHANRVLEVTAVAGVTAV